MTFAFETHVLPLLQEMAEDPLGEFPLQSRVGELDFIETAEASTRYLDLLKSSGYVSFKGQKQGDGTYSFVYEAALTAKALEQLDLWPSDNERGLYLLNRLGEAPSPPRRHNSKTTAIRRQPTGYMGSVRP